MAVGIQFDCKLKNPRLSSSIIPLKVRPKLKAASAPATAAVLCDVKAPC